MLAVENTCPTCHLNLLSFRHLRHSKSLIRLCPEGFSASVRETEHHGISQLMLDSQCKALQQRRMASLHQ